ncbi:6-bladed beta-propeller [Parapedobacter sp. GCM10030251]|uniref:6-bladed beta-propeller n=1 Tax=Parapedobacter sp. GCM10030251 TaxID=3273419 RepID=UPI003617A358
MDRNMLRRASFDIIRRLDLFESYMKRVASLIPFLWFATSCSGDRNRVVYVENEDHYIVDIAAMGKVDNTRELIEEIAFIPLETNEQSLLADIDKVIFHRNRFYVHDKKFASLKVFGEDGKYIRSIGNIGRGPGEFTTLMDFILDPQEDKLLLLSNNEKAVIEYDLEGKYLQTRRTNVFASSFAKIGDSYYYFINQNDNDVSGLNNLIVMDENSRVLDRQFPFSKAFDVMLPSHCFLLENASGALFHPTLSDTVFQLTADRKVYPKYAFDFGEKALPQIMRTAYEVYNTNEKYKYSRLGNRFVETENVVSFNYSDGRLMIPSAFCNKRSVDTVQGRKVLKPLRLDFPVSNTPVLGLMGDDTFITYVRAEFAEYVRNGIMSSELLHENFPDLHALIPELQIGDNPVLVTFKLKLP